MRERLFHAASGPLSMALVQELDGPDESVLDDPADADAAQGHVEAEGGEESLVDVLSGEEAGRAHGSVARHPVLEKLGLTHYLARVRKAPALSQQDEAALAIQAQAGSLAAMNRLIAHSLHVVPPVAHKYLDRGLSLEDLIQEGNLGLYAAVPKFDAALGFRFGTYARWWVRQQIRSAVLNHGRIVRLPAHVYRALAALRRQQEGRPGANARTGPAATPTGAEAPMSFDDAEKLLLLTQRPLSLDHPVEAGSDVALVDVLPATDGQAPEEQMDRRARGRLLHQAIEQLTRAQREVVLRRYGFATGEPETLDAIGRSMSITGERVRQLQRQALLRMRDLLQQSGAAEELLSGL